METTFSQIQKNWNSQPFLERLLFAMNRLKFSQEEGEKLAKLDFRSISRIQKLAIYKALN